MKAFTLNSAFVVCVASNGVWFGAPDVQLRSMLTVASFSSLKFTSTMNESFFKVFVIVQLPTATSAAWQVPGGSPLPL